MTIFAWRKKRDRETDDFVLFFDPKPDITAFELSKLVKISIAGRPFRVAPIHLKDLAAEVGDAYRHLVILEKPATEHWPIFAYRPALKRAA